MLAGLVDGFVELPEPPDVGDGAAEDGPLAWPGYGAARERAVARTGERESVLCGTGRVDGTGAVLIVFEFAFLGGSLGEHAGARIEAAHAYARARHLPLVSLVASGGSRMQEGMRALSQLQRVARQTALTGAAGVPQISVARHPTTGGGWAAVAAGADVCLALGGAEVAFAGSRIRPAGTDPRAACTAEAQLAAGHVDGVVPADGLRRALGRWLSLLSGPAAGRVAPPYALGAAAPPQSGWAAVERARDAGRPRADAYLDACFSFREEIGGDRCGGRDEQGVTCGFGRLPDGRTAAFAAQRGTAVRPAGLRTAARLVRLADRLGFPVLTLVDTPGAAGDIDAERAGTGPAVADCFAAVVACRTPVTTLVVGEGGSGGALALAAPGRTWMTPDSYFSVLAPEAATAVLKRDPSLVRETAEQLRLRPQDVVELGVARGIVGPPPGRAAVRRRGAGHPDGTPRGG
ncbi:carboxyl transferase domain-containing protein [Streptomyces sp. TR02-1]|uniref:carboxyl transferase domain-containing protein n=1 Tax=Streptomyces sp. TR02-1 TaxID=3385977 RepID=UPI0039A0B660